MLLDRPPALAVPWFCLAGGCVLALTAVCYRCTQIKLGMYDQLGRVLIGFVLAWTMLSIVIIMAQQSVVQLSWKLSWLVLRFWDVLYFLLLAMVRCRALSSHATRTRFVLASHFCARSAGVAAGASLMGITVPCCADLLVVGTQSEQLPVGLVLAALQWRWRRSC